MGNEAGARGAPAGLSCSGGRGTCEQVPGAAAPRTVLGETVRAGVQSRGGRGVGICRGYLRLGKCCVCARECECVWA